MSIIAYRYGAACHCPECAVNGVSPEHRALGERAVPVLSADVWQQLTGECETLRCATCGEAIQEHHVNEGGEFVGRERSAGCRCGLEAMGLDAFVDAYVECALWSSAVVSRQVV